MINNVVIQGDYNNYAVSISKETSGLFLEGANDSIEFSKDIINSYEVISTEYKKNIIDILVRIIIGSYLLGPIGLLCGFTASNTSVYCNIIAIEFTNGKKSLIKLDKKRFKTLINILF